jgi:iron(III) transport system substrate-binding protein
MKFSAAPRYVVPALAGLGSRLKAELHTIAMAALIFVFIGCGESQRTVVVYTSQDQIYAEPLLAEFTRQTGIKVLPVFDSESVKTAGLVQRLIAEKENPRADIFWSNEEMLAHQLLERGIVEFDFPTGYRTRRLVVNTNLVPLKGAPKNLDELTDPKWAGKIALAYPMYGTTAAHMTALRQKWGDEKWQRWCKGLIANKPFVVDGNSMVVRLVGTGEAALGLTDSDDVAAGQRNNLPIASADLGEDLLAIPGTVTMVKGAPHRAAAKTFLMFAHAQDTVDLLVQNHAVEGVSPPQDALRLSLPADVEGTQAILKRIFARE